MGNLNKKNIIDEAEKILAKCEEKYKEEGKNKKKLKELEKQYKKLKRSNIIWKVVLATVIVVSLIIII